MSPSLNGDRGSGNWHNLLRELVNSIMNFMFMTNKPVFAQPPCLSLNNTNTAKNLKLTRVEHACSFHDTVLVHQVLVRVALTYVDGIWNLQFSVSSGFMACGRYGLL